MSIEIKKSENVLHFNCYCLSFDEFRKRIEFILKDIKETLLIPSTEFEIDMFYSAEGDCLSYGNIWIEKKNYLNIILGLNEDGSQRIEEIEDPEWEAKNKDKLKEIEDKELAFKNDTNANWADEADLEEDKQDLINTKIIERKIDPLVVIKNLTIFHDDESRNIHLVIWKRKEMKNLVKHTADLKKNMGFLEREKNSHNKIKIRKEIEYLNNKINKIRSNTDEYYLREIGDSVKIKFFRAEIRRENGHNFFNRLCCKFNEKIDLQTLHEIFDKYAKIKTKTERNKTIHYPIIELKDKLIIITYSEDNLDADEALLMQRKTIIKIGDEKISLIFYTMKDY